MVAILLALVSLSGSRVECVAVVPVAWKNVLVHFGQSVAWKNVLVAVAWKNVLLHFSPQNVLVHFGPSVSWKNVLLYFLPQNVLVHFGLSQWGSGFVVSLLNVLQHTPAMKHWS